MKKFLIKFLVIGVVSISLIFTFVLLSPSNSNHSLASLIDKHKYLEEAKGNKMILVGGSNIAMGIDSNMLEEEFDYDVVNMGINAGLGLRFMLNDAKQFIEDGDVVVIAPEYSQFIWGLNGESLLNIILKEVPSSIKSMDTNHIETLISTFPEFVRNRIAITIKGIVEKNGGENEYTRSAYDNNGDMISHLGIESREVKAGITEMGEVDPEVIKCLNEFYEYVKNKKAKVYLSYPALFDQQYMVWKEDIVELDNVLNEECEIPVISKPEKYVYYSNEIYDTIYHVNELGRYNRTMPLIEDLKGKLITN